MKKAQSMEKYRPEALQSKTDMANRNEKVVGGLTGSRGL